MDAHDPFVPLPMPEPPWLERVSVLVVAAERDGQVVAWSHGDEVPWLDEVEASGLASVLEREIEARGLDGVASVRPMPPHYVAILDGYSARDLLSVAVSVLQRFSGPLPHGSRAVLTHREGEGSGLHVDMVELP